MWLVPLFTRQWFARDTILQVVRRAVLGGIPGYVYVSASTLVLNDFYNTKRRL